jgi:hypothetical protein
MLRFAGDCRAAGDFPLRRGLFFETQHFKKEIDFKQ